MLADDIPLHQIPRYLIPAQMGDGHSRGEVKQSGAPSILHLRHAEPLLLTMLKPRHTPKLHVHMYLRDNRRIRTQPRYKHVQTIVILFNLLPPPALILIHHRAQIIEVVLAGLKGRLDVDVGGSRGIGCVRWFWNSLRRLQGGADDYHNVASYLESVVCSLAFVVSLVAVFDDADDVDTRANRHRMVVRMFRELGHGRSKVERGDLF
ncbi:hypothetical protein K469DRAFT_260273 [Zopfia rhizophila CBS 207.26]|uniref:Uncharacterized protein n=1 Tax=Zopfia rhizophila CBS 207.26 TaxID=1314779 RepID=A0A6A6DPQ6_9PEZI|nr:hypothetical protein K469DRAFT_260273 [Zopfia rhizophila CBS 207.26]